MSYTLKNYKRDVWNFLAYQAAVGRAIVKHRENKEEGGLSDVWLHEQEEEIEKREAQLAAKAKELNLSSEEVTKIWEEIGGRQCLPVKS